MKMVKKILLGLSAAAAVLALASCGKQIGDSSIKFTGTLTKPEIDCTNETGSTIRSAKLYATKHLGSICTLEIDNQTASSYDGQLGYMFNVTQNDDKTYNFISVGFRNNKGSVDTYISYYTQIDEDAFSSDNFGAKVDSSTLPSVAIKSKDGFAREYVIKALPTNLTGFSIEDGVVTGAVEVVAVTDNTKGENVGGYIVNFYPASELDNNRALKDDHAEVNSKNSFSIAAEVAGYDSSATNLTTVMQQKLGIYAAIYKNAALTGSWYATDFEKNPIPADFE